MSKLVMALVLVGSLVVGAVPVMAQQGGIGDPLTLAASGVVIPFATNALSGLGTVATLQVASPVGDNPNAHMFFFAANCIRIPISLGVGMTTNDIEFRQIGSAQGGPVPTGIDGLIALAGADSTGFGLEPLKNPIHARVYQFDPTLAGGGRSRVFEPIIINTAEFPSVAHWWSPLRTGATFFAPLQIAGVQTDLTLICPRNTIEGAIGAAFGVDPGGVGPLVFTDLGFPQIRPAFPSTSDPGTIRVRMYDDDEDFFFDFTIVCPCFAPFPAIAVTVSPFYASAAFFPSGTYTELTVPTSPANPRISFTGYTSTFTVGNPLNTFFGRIHNGSQVSIDGTVLNQR